MTTYIASCNDYRTGKEIYILDLNQVREDYKEEIGDQKLSDEELIDNFIDRTGYSFEFQTPEDGNHLLIVDEFEKVTVSKIETKLNNLYEQLYSKINESLPFVVTGITSGYKEKGYYPPPVKCNKNILTNVQQTLINNSYEVSLITVENGITVDLKQIIPVF